MKKRITLLIVLSILLLSAHGILAGGYPLVSVYRVYNPSSQEHLYTIYDEEVNNLVSKGWIDEGIAWLSEDPDDSRGIPVYRLYCHATGRHLYTIDSSEVENLVDSGIWSLDFNGEPLFRAINTENVANTSNIVPVYRLYNSSIQAHILTIDQNEYNVLPSLGWRQEGIAFNAYSN